MHEALSALQDLGVPQGQRNERSALTLLALLNLQPETPWAKAANPFLGIAAMMDWFRKNYGKSYKPNTRETVRRQTVHQFVELGLAIANPDKPDRPVNSPKYGYIFEPSAVALFRKFGSSEWSRTLEAFKRSLPKLKSLHHQEREMAKTRISLPNGATRLLSGGGQNSIIRQIVEEFCPRFTPQGRVIYLGDAGSKLAVAELDAFAKLGITIDRHGKMPDVVVHMADKNWLILIEAAASHGPIEVKRKIELEALMKGSTAGLVFVTAVSDRKALVKYLGQIAWESEVWVAENPTHMIHFNGERFLGPYDGPKDKAKSAGLSLTTPATASNIQAEIDAGRVYFTREDPPNAD